MDKEAKLLSMQLEAAKLRFEQAQRRVSKGLVAMQKAKEAMSKGDFELAIQHLQIHLDGDDKYEA